MAGIYIHIPFCHSKCAYCDFFSRPINRDIDGYIETLHKEYERRKDELAEPVTTIYLGGGTPSSVGVGNLEKLMRWLPIDNVTEFTIEVNPEDIDPPTARFLAESPVNRVSMGVQSLDDGELRFIGRRHSASQALDAYRTLRENGIDNISLDLIFGLPGQSVGSWEKTLEMTLALAPDHLSAYSLMLEEGTRLRAMRDSGKFKETDDETIERMYMLLCEKTAKAGFSHYEISNFAREGRQSLHNSSYWNLTPYLGLGTGAHSYDGFVRRYNPWNIKKYIETGGEIEETDEEDFAGKVNDYLLIRLRTAEGLSLNETEARFGAGTADTVRRQARKSIMAGNLIYEKERLIIPPEKWLISDSVISDLML